MAILQQRARSHGDRRFYSVEEREEVGYQRVGQLRAHKVLQYLLVAGVAQCYCPQVVLLHKLVEEVGTQHHRLCYLHLRLLKLVQFWVALYYLVEECQTAAFASQRALADTGKVGVAVKLQSVEHCYHTYVLHTSVLHDGIEDYLSVGIHVLQLVPRHVFQECRNGEDGTCAQPAAHVVARYVIQHRVIRYLEYVVLQLLQ